MLGEKILEDKKMNKKKTNLDLVVSMVCTVLLLTGQAQAVIVSTSGGGIVLDSPEFSQGR